MDLAKAKRGSEYVKSKSGGNFTPVIYWKEDKETHFLAFITPVDEIVTAEVHTFQTKNGWRTFICRRDPVFEDEGGYCPLCEEYGDSPGRRHLAIAAELDTVKERVGGRQTITDVKVKLVEVERDGETKSYPRIGLVMQAASNFFNYLTAYDAQRQHIHTLSWEVQRDGKGGKTSYNFFPVDMRPDLSEYEDQFPDPLQYLAEKGSAEHYATELEGTPPPDTAAAAPAASRTTTQATTEDPTDQFEELRRRLETKTTSGAA